MNNVVGVRLMDALLVALPKLLFCSISALPLILGTIAAARTLKANARSAYFRYLLASMAAGALALAMLWSSLFGDSLSRSSTAALIFAIVPVYAAGAFGIAYGVAALVFKTSLAPRPIALPARLAILAPLILLAILLFGLVKISADGNDSAIAQRTSDPAALQRLLDKSRSNDDDAFGIALSLAQNDKVPVAMLTELAQHTHPVIRANVVSNPRTPEHIVAALRYDCASFVRKAVVQRLGAASAPQPSPEPTGKCALARWR